MEPALTDDQPVPQPSDSAPLNSPLNRIPIDIGHHRAHLFALETPVQFDQSAWERYWPFIDNVWCLHNKADVTAHLVTSGKTEKFWGGCRLQRKWRLPERKEETSRNRSRREPGQCPAKFRVVMSPEGVRTLERSKEGHSHDLDHIDSIKRTSGIRALVMDPFFTSWDSGPILAYLKDPANAPPSAPDLFVQAGGRYLERREIVNIFSQKLRQAYPSLDAATLKKQKEKYEGFRTCNIKGCNLSFRDSKELAKHKKEAHEERRHDHSDKLYTCPNKQCHRHKRSKGFTTATAVREHQVRMAHWGLVGYHGDNEGMRLIEMVTREERLATESGQEVDFVDIDGSAEQQTLETQGMLHQRPLPNLSLFPQMHGNNVGSLHDTGTHGGMLQLSSTMHEQDPQQRQDMLHRLEALEVERQRMEQEMERLRNALYTG